MRAKKDEKGMKMRVKMRVKKGAKKDGGRGEKVLEIFG